MSDTLYIIQAISYEYNDETYNRGDNGGGHPEKAFRSKEKATKEMNTLTAAKLRTWMGNPGQYGYDISEITHASPDDLEKHFFRFGFKYDPTERSYNAFSGHDLKKLDDEEIIEYWSIFDIPMYEIVEISYDDADIEEPANV